MKNIVTGLCRRAKLFFNGVINLFRKPAGFLRQGRKGGIAACALLTIQFIYGAVLYAGECILPGPVIFIAGLAALVAAEEIVLAVLRLVIGKVSRSGVWFLIAATAVTAVSLESMQMNNEVAAIITGFLPALAADILGRCVFSIIAANNYRYVTGYVMTAGSLAVVALFGVFYRFDSFGDNPADIYLAAKQTVTSVAENIPGSENIYEKFENGTENEDSDKTNTDSCSAETEVQSVDIREFSAYLQPGSHEVAVIDYGPSQECEIVTGEADVSGYAEREGMQGLLEDIYFDNSLQKAPIAGRIWYPCDGVSCPVLFIVHGNHAFDVQSHLGYSYLGEYLASNGYVVVSVDENILNCMSGENDARAVLLLENIRALLKENISEDSALYNRINPDRIAVAGHSRGGEMITDAFLFSKSRKCPDNGNINYDYDFDIKALIAIAPTSDQYMPGGFSARPENVNYLLIQGGWDQDVSRFMGEKQYNNIVFDDDAATKQIKASVYILNANHGQFNSMWGRYDLSGASEGFLNTAPLLDETEQQLIAKAYIRTFLDMTLLGDDRFAALLVNNDAFAQALPKTVYVTNYQDNGFVMLNDFESEGVVSGYGLTAENDNCRVVCRNMKSWRTVRNVSGNGEEEENHVLECKWSKGVNPTVEIDIPETDMTDLCLSFRMADMSENKPDNMDGRDAGINYIVVLRDSQNREVSCERPIYIYPGLAVQLYKSDIFTGNYEYKHPLQTICVAPKMFSGDADFDFSTVSAVNICINEESEGKIIIDSIGLQKP